MSPPPPAFTFGLAEAGGESLPVIRRGPDNAPRVLILQPLYEELNRTRRLLALTGVALAALGIASWLPDLPGTGDHGAPALDWPRAHAAAAALAAQLGRPHVLAVRGGALFAAAAQAPSAYLLAPVPGRSLLRDLFRTRAAADAEAGTATTPAALEARSAAGETLELAGNPVAPALAAALAAAEPPPPGPHIRIASVGEAPAADVALPGPPVWRQAEPLDARPLAAALAADIAQWIAARS